MVYKFLNFLFLFSATIFISACNTGGGGSGGSTSNSECPPFIEVGGENYNEKLCLRNQEIQQFCDSSASPCRGQCISLSRELSARGIRGAAAIGRIESCNRACEAELSSCLYQHKYIEGVCQSPTTIHNPDCQPPPPPVDQSSGGSNSSNSDPCFGQGYWTNFGCPGYCQFNPSLNGCSGSETNGATNSGTTTSGTTTGGTTTSGTTTGGTTTGGNTTGGNTTGGNTTGGNTTGGNTTGGTTTGGTTTGGTTTGGTTTGGTWTAISTVGAPTPRHSHSAVWTGTEMIIWGGTEEYIQGTTPKTRLAISGGRYNPKTNKWLSMRDAPLTRREGYSILWTGSHLIVYGGTLLSQSTESGWVSGPTNTGAMYDPANDSWTPIAISSFARTGHLAYWTGNRMLLWGGSVSNQNWPYSNPTTNEILFDPNNYTWTGVNLPNSVKSGAAAWTGSELLIWGGSDVGGGFYNPNTNAWRSISELGAPGLGSVFWTGSKMLVWGPGLAGGIYNPLSDSWSQISLTGAINGKAVWTDSELIVWDSFNKKSSAFNPENNSWRSLSSTGAPTGRYNHSSIWTGSELVIWGGLNSSTSKFENSGGNLEP